MSYLVFARKYRPQTFEEVYGQEHVTRTLRNGITRGKIAHAFLFAGPRGVGKTSVARIFSKALNCKGGPTANPCLKCSSCEEITNGSSMAVREIDGASHNSVDNVRELIDSFRTLPPPGYKYKIYIIDEVHMLSTAAFNALLKSLEEPPPHTIFILATTEAHKIPETVISRCQQHDFRALESHVVEKCLADIAASEKIKVDPEVLKIISRLSEGSMRDAQSLFDRLQLFCDGAVSMAEATKLLGAVGFESLLSLSREVINRTPDKALEILLKCFETGIDTSLFIRDFVSHWRTLELLKFTPAEKHESFGLSSNMIEECRKQIQHVSARDVHDYVHIAVEGADSALRSSFPRLAIEALVVRMCLRERVQDIANVINSLRSITSSYKQKTGTSDAREPEHRGQQAQSLKEQKADRSNRLEWGLFIQFVVDEGNKMLAEQLRRMVPEEFRKGLLVMRGPEFSLGYLNHADQKERLRGLLTKFSSLSDWEIKLNPGNHATEPEDESLFSKEKKQSSKAREEREKDISNHPNIKSLQKIFPGAKIETIKLKDM